jgi:hypothetical protein
VTKYHSGNKVGADVTAPKGEHVWTIIAVWRVDPVKALSGQNIDLDRENLLTITGTPGCFICEQAYSLRVLSTPCPGEPARA